MSCSDSLYGGDDGDGSSLSSGDPDADWDWGLDVDVDVDVDVLFVALLEFDGICIDLEDASSCTLPIGTLDVLACVCVCDCPFGLGFDLDFVEVDVFRFLNAAGTNAMVVPALPSDSTSDFVVLL